MTTTPAKPTFTPDARGNYPCPHPGCQRTFAAPQHIGRHWSATHAPTQPQRDDTSDGLDDLRTMWAEVQAEKAREELHATLDETEDDDEHDEHDEHDGELTLRNLVRDLHQEGISLRLLEPTDVLTRTHACTRCTDHAQAIADSTIGLVDAIVRLRNAGYDRTDAITVVHDLIDKLHTPRGTAA